MPHIQIKDFKELSFPFSHEGIDFSFIASNIKYPNEKLICVQSEEKNFLLQVKRVEDKWLLKSDKVTRVSPNYHIKNAINAYASKAELEILFTNLAQKQMHHAHKESALKPINFFAKSFPKAEEIWVEVGFGSGVHLLHQAQENPDVLHIGIEIHKASIEQVLKQISILELDNIMLVDFDARLFLEFVPSNLVGRIFVHFPVPWDKKPHRRVISHPFISESLRALKEKGTLELRTDSENYFAYALQTFLELNQSDFQVRKNQNIGIISKYESRWRKMEKNIYDISLSNHEISEPIKNDYDFSLAHNSTENIEQLNTQTIRFENGFIHFERIYGITDGGYLVRLSMGSFDKPEHLFILIKDEKTSYFPHPPIASKTNHNAHLKLKELLYG
ncbi:tRNA (guanosine(46)-N7)-methyltransferase TrmB [Sulfurimonas sp. MAG313]|nr:tRNA (guanosine(46)-N7)-methyltransferase TrmB [Sulfurimonas sp. MAG313]MDF1882249.1 tRNA (guanosine(46)-N7)-methyltransferase TrmB [Sulfurimonas sp. MAG313]